MVYMLRLLCGTAMWNLSLRGTVFKSSSEYIQPQHFDVNCWRTEERVWYCS